MRLPTSLVVIDMRVTADAIIGVPAT